MEEPLSIPEKLSTYINSHNTTLEEINFKT
jgi:hypothetical protein